jgi:hypothetical protein
MSTAVMPGLGPGIHVLLGGDKDVDGRDKPGHDVERFSYRLLALPARAVAEALKTDGGAVQVVGVGALNLDLGNLADP